jgi:hypothetical protein
MGAISQAVGRADFALVASAHRKPESHKTPFTPPSGLLTEPFDDQRVGLVYLRAWPN